MTKRADRASRVRQRLSQIPADIGAEVGRMVRVREMIRGYVYQSRRRCGKPSCRCARGELHEAWVLATKVDGKPTTRSLGGGRRGRVQRLTDNYRRFRQAQRAIRKLCREVTELGRELEGLLAQAALQEGRR
jgi:hypothetical protein